MDQLAELLPQILDKFSVKNCIAIGEGAGADIICRFAVKNIKIDGIIENISLSSFSRKCWKALF